MKRLVYLLIIVLVLGLIFSGCDLVTPLIEKEEVTSLTKATPIKPPSGAHYNLNIIGKKSGWSGGGSYDNPDRHTMFVPEDTTGWTILTPGDDDTTNVGVLPGIKIAMTQGDEFAVLDGNAFDDGECAFQLAPGKYKVWITAKAKPPKPGEDYYTNIGGWVFAEDEYEACYYYNIGSVTVKKNLGWLDATHIFYVSPGEDYFKIISSDMWVFEYLSFLTEYDFGDVLPDITDAAYFWQYDNHGNKLVKVRFYPD
ncbi:MAG: hypothetical protein MUP34_02330 [Candidatus Atribacteria bacterium]|nr:hypothetical protein [Candidatus Atribacteria bacterium]